MTDQQHNGDSVPADQDESWLSRTRSRLDDFQQRHPVLAIPIAVYKKFSDDDAGKLAALISYYAFLSVFPLLIVLATVVSYALAGNQELAQQFVTTAAGSFLSIGSTGNVQPLNISGFALAVGVMVALWSGLAVVNGMQDAMNTVYEVPKTERPGLPQRIWRSVTLLVIVGIGLPATAVLQGAVTQWSDQLLVTGLATVVVLAINAGLIAAAFRRATVAPTTWRGVAPGAALAALAWSIMQGLAGTLLTRRVEGAEATYGSFALVIALLFWFFLLAQVTLFCAELNSVLTFELWPRSLKSVIEAQADTDADLDAYSRYPKREKQANNITVEVDLTKEPTGRQ